MSRSTVLAWFLLFSVLSSTAFAQQSGQDDAAASPESGDQGEGEASGKAQSSTANWVRMKPMLQLGDTGDRVRELQATLNLRLTQDESRIVKLGKGAGISVGPPKGARETTKEQLRDVLFTGIGKLQIRGHWVPLDGDRNPIIFNIGSPDSSTNGELRPTAFLRMPQQPLHVDGVFGPHTKAAVAIFQASESLPITGEVDAVTLDKLEPLVPTNALLAFIMTRVDIFKSKGDSYPFMLKTLTSLCMTVLIILASTFVYQYARMAANSTNFLSRWLFTPSSSPWFTALRRHKVFLRIAQLAPAIFIYAAAVTIFPAPITVASSSPSSPDQHFAGDPFPYLTTFQEWHVIVSRLGLAYISLVLMLVAFAFANACDGVYNPDSKTENPISSIVRAAKRFIGLIGTILIFAALLGRNPFFIVGGVGAFMAVFMLVFRDYLLGLVASIQIVANNVVQVGDWITMPKFNADGDVTEMSLTMIKVQNFDKTLSSIPTSTVLSESFQNWSGMQRAGGRRIKRSLLIDMQSISVCTPEMIERFADIELIGEYIKKKGDELDEYNRRHNIEASVVNSRRLTNIGTFRAYLEAYLKQHSGLNDEMTFLVRHLPPTSKGLPIEIYAFCIKTNWAEYEAIQADIFDHLLAILPEFGLKAFQEETTTLVGLGMDATMPAKVREAIEELETLVESNNRELADNRRASVPARMKRIARRAAELNLDAEIQLAKNGRRIVLERRHR